MPSTLSYPGVYIEEIPSGVRTITGVATSVAAFIDYFSRGVTNKAVQVFSFADFEREFGGLDPQSEASYAIQQFFLNGGSEAWVVRVVTTGASTGNAVPATVQIGNSTGGNALLATAISEGKWGNNLRAKVDTNGVATGEFNLTIMEVASSAGRVSVVRQEVFRNLSMDSTKRNFVNKVVNDATTGSRLVWVTATAGSTAPVANGTLSGTHAVGGPTILASPTLKVTIGSSPQTTLALNLPAGAQLLSVIAPVLEGAIRAASPANPSFAGATVSVVGNQLYVLAGGDNPADTITFANASTTDTTAADLLLTTTSSTTTTVTINSQAYILGITTVANAQLGGQVGANGALPGSGAIIGDLVNKRGIYALEDVDLFNILCLPRAAVVTGPDSLTDPQSQALLSVAEAYCEKRRAFLIIDTPTGLDDPQKIKNWLQANGSLRHRNAALFYPRVKIPDPLDDFRLRSFGASGTVAGLFARTDSTRGVWKAPAGTEVVARNVSELEDVLSDMENGALNPLAINCLRNFPAYGNVVWGARTLDGADQNASEWKYIPVRRLALFLEESLYRGTQWVVFEPNDEPLWAQIRLNLGAFMHNLFRQGAFQGTTPKEAYFVKCDKETTTQNDINLGVVNIVVGFAPLKPAEFVVIKIQQMAGQIET
jgi:uncharacterized protein